MPVAYPLQEILKVRMKRQELAQTEVIKATHALEMAKLELKKREEELDKYRIWRKEEEQKRYDKMINKKLPHYQLNEIKAEISQLREDEAIYVNKVDQAQIKIDECEATLQQAKEMFFRMVRECQKIQEHRDEWMQQATKEELIAEDKELEEFQAKKEIDI